MNKVYVLEDLKRYYSKVLAEDKQDGTSFDCMVLDAIDSLIALQEGNASNFANCPYYHRLYSKGVNYCPWCGRKINLEK